MQPDPHARRRELLAGHFLLQHLSPAELDELLRFARERRYADGEVIFRRGDPVEDGMLLVLNGQVRLHLTEPGGRELTLALAGADSTTGRAARTRRRSPRFPACWSAAPRRAR